MTLLMLTMTSSLERLTANRTSVSQLRIVCLLLPDAAGVGAARPSGALTDPDGAVTQNTLVIRYTVRAAWSCNGQDVGLTTEWSWVRLPVGCHQAVTNWMGDCPWTAKPYQYITNHQGQLGLLLLQDR